MSIVLPDYENCGLNVIASVMRYFDTPCHHKTLPFLDEKLKNVGYRNVVVMLFDGMGMDALKKNSPADSFLNTHIAHELSAVFPSTTTAATTAIECAASPAEHGWLGWTIYFEEIDKSVDIFINRDAQKGGQAADYSVAERFMPLDPVFHRITEAGKAKAAIFSPFAEPACQTLEDIRQGVLDACREPGAHYLYAYYPEPDHTMHARGVYAQDIKEQIAAINTFSQGLAKELPKDTLLLLTADHGLINGHFLYLEDHPSLRAMLLRPPTVEARVAVFHVKPECADAFPKAFSEAFPQNFVLKKSDEVLKSGIFGPGKPHPKLPGILGDYVAFATAYDCIGDARGDHELIGCHAGLTEEEMRVPLIVAKE